MKELILIFGVVMMWLGGYAFGEKSNDGHKLLTECEAKLPRNERCILVAVPETGGKDE